MKKVDHANYESELKKLIEVKLNLLSFKDKANILRSWGGSSYYQTPESFLGEARYINYLYYLLVNSIDNLIGNGKDFIPSQKYRNEAIRLLIEDLSILTYKFEPTDSYSCTNAKLWLMLRYVDAFEGQPNSYDFNHDYRIDFRREFRNRKFNMFDKSYLKSMMSESDYKNFLIYMKLYLIDEKLACCSPFVPSQDYKQEYIRQSKIDYLREGLEKNESFHDFHDAICRAKDGIYADDFYDLKANPEDIDWTYKTMI